MISQHPSTFLSPLLQREKLASFFVEIAPWLDTSLVMARCQDRGWTTDQAIGEQLNTIELWCQKLAETVEKNSLELAWIHDMIGKTSLINKARVPYSNATEWITQGMGINADLLRFSINQYAAWQAIESYDIPPDLFQQAQPTQLILAKQIITESHKQYDDIVKRKAGNKSLDEIPWEEQEKLYREVDKDNRERVRQGIITALQTEPSSAHEAVAQHGGQIDKPCFFVNHLAFDEKTMTLRGEFFCSLNPNQVQAMKLGKYTNLFQVNGENFTVAQYGRKISELTQ